jgi:hypothetical protein
MPATYPNAIKVFQTFHDYTDIIWAISINECHDEIVALENLLGIKPFTGTPYTTFGGAIYDLYMNKAPLTHTHEHRNLLDDNQGNDHPQYIQVNGYPGFTHPVTGKAGTNSADLVPLSQLNGMGYQNAAQVQAAINAALGNLMAGARGGPPLLVVGNPNVAPAWVIQGGIYSQVTDAGGRINIPFNHNYPNLVQAFTATKLPPQGNPGPAPNYNWIEAQTTIVGVGSNYVTLQVSHDYSWQGGMWFTCSWIAIGA